MLYNPSGSGCGFVYSNNFNFQEFILTPFVLTLKLQVNDFNPCCIHLNFARSFITKILLFLLYTFIHKRKQLK